jgi:UDP-GlcNAc3NAcA epimerase
MSTLQKKIIAVIGARPQFIKHAPVSIELKKKFELKTIHTGQHYDANMSAIFFDELKISKPEYLLTNIGKNHGEQTGNMLIEIEKILVKEKPDYVLVYGDTNSTIAGALAASKLNIKVIHIEAGLRSFNKSMPEEINRIVTDHLSDILICPSEIAVANITKEGVTNNVFICGDVMKDMLFMAAPYMKDPLDGKEYIFATIHRPYNTDSKERMIKILHAFNNLNQKVIFPIHPRTIARVKEFGIKTEELKNISFTEPMGYFDTLSYQKYSQCVITDSGGVQKEAYWLKRKCITLRPETEWVETTYEGWNTLLFDELEKINQIVREPVKGKYDNELYGDGKASAEILKIITNYASV